MAYTLVVLVYLRFCIHLSKCAEYAHPKYEHPRISYHHGLTQMPLCVDDTNVLSVWKKISNLAAFFSTRQMGKAQFTNNTLEHGTRAA